MKTLGLVVSVIVAFVVYGVIAMIAAFLALSIWAGGLEIETFLWIVLAIGLAIGSLGAAIPFLRRGVFSLLTAFAPSSW